MPRLLKNISWQTALQDLHQLEDSFVVCHTNVPIGRRGTEVVGDSDLPSRTIIVADDEKKDPVTSATAILAIVLSLVSLGFTMFWNSPAGDVRPIEPTDIGIIRGVKWNITGSEGTERLADAPSDHIVMPLSWQNNSGSSVLIQAPKLRLEELDKAPEDGGVPIGKPHSLLLYGEYPEASVKVFTERESKPPAYKSSLILEPHSASQNMLIFRVMRWDSRNKNFRIRGDAHYRVSIKYEQIPTIETVGIPRGFHPNFLYIAGRDIKDKALLEDWHTFDNVDCLQLYGEPVKPEDANPACEYQQWHKKRGKTVPPGYGWEWRSLVAGARE